MLSLLGSAALKLFEAELEKHSPEIQSYLLNELGIAAKSAMELIQKKIIEKAG